MLFNVSINPHANDDIFATVTLDKSGKYNIECYDVSNQIDTFLIFFKKYK